MLSWIKYDVGRIVDSLLPIALLMRFQGSVGMTLHAE